MAKSKTKLCAKCKDLIRAGTGVRKKGCFGRTIYYHKKCSK